MVRAVLGVDVGGANLKAAHTAGVARSRPFALWKEPDGLSEALRELLLGMPSADLVALTMTGELCDCYDSKRQGVVAILEGVERAVGKTAIRVWRTDGQFCDIAQARREPLQVASANWLATATYVGRFAPSGAALLLDVGSTTTDIVPLHDGKPIPRGRTDPERLRANELVYTGVRRTPLCALLAGQVAAELFATTLDAYLIMGELSEDPNDRMTADGRPATRAAAHARLSRMLCADLETCTEQERRALALKAVVRQEVMIGFALERVAERLPGPPRAIVLGGEGEFLAFRSLGRQERFPPCQVIGLGQRLGDGFSRAACAHAVAVLAAEAT
jgi:probable H4MPT-linked C1 transfer pathway protein